MSVFLDASAPSRVFKSLLNSKHARESTLTRKLSLSFNHPHHDHPYDPLLFLPLAKEQIIRFLQQSDYILIPLVLTLLSFWTRFRDIKSSNYVVWDEVCTLMHTTLVDHQRSCLIAIKWRSANAQLLLLQLLLSLKDPFPLQTPVHTLYRSLE